MSETVIIHHNDVRYFYFLNTFELFNNLYITQSMEPFSHYVYTFLEH